MPVELQKSRAVVRVTGTESQKLLNAVLTSAVGDKPGPASWWALLSPQGKVQAEGLAGWTDGAFWLDMHESVADAFLKRMRLYKLRADVTFEDLRDSHCVGWSAQPIEAEVVHADPRVAGLGFRVIAPSEAAEGWQEGEAFSRARIAAGIVSLGEDVAADTHFPHDFGMDLLAGVDFKKGCYIGQEVVSRMQHRGTARRRPVIAAGDGIVDGANVLSDGRDAGTVGKVVDGKAVAIVRLDRIETRSGLTCGGAPVSLALPDWASYRFGDPASGDSDNT